MWTAAVVHYLYDTIAIVPTRENRSGFLCWQYLCHHYRCDHPDRYLQIWPISWKWKITGPVLWPMLQANTTTSVYAVKSEHRDFIPSAQCHKLRGYGQHHKNKLHPHHCLLHPCREYFKSDFAISRVTVGRVDTLVAGTVQGLDIQHQSCSGNSGLQKQYCSYKKLLCRLHRVTKLLKLFYRWVVNTISLLPRPSNYNPANTNIWIDYNQDGSSRLLSSWPLQDQLLELPMLQLYVPVLCQWCDPHAYRNWFWKFIKHSLRCKPYGKLMITG